MQGLIGSVPFHGFRFAGRRFDCGTKLGFLEASIAYALAHDDMAGGARALIDKFATALARKDST
jgi:UTP--glucose-1-phosphate uridylyltransferase